MSEVTNTFTTVGSETCLEMFRVQPGIPMERVLGEIAVLQGCIRHLSTEAEMEGDLLAGSAARILSDMAKALANDLERGMNRAGR